MVIKESNIKKECLENILKDFPADLLERLFKGFASRVAFEKKDSSALVLKKIWSDPELAKEFMDKFDDYACNGRQHIFFFRLRDKEYLEILRDERELTEKWPDEASSLINKKIFLWEADFPSLVEVRHKVLPEPGQLVIKWVETRLWDERLSGTTMFSTPKYVRRKERSVNYFIIDLSNGNAQMHLQLIRPNPLKPLKQEYAIYQKEVSKLIDFNKFVRVPLESVMKSLLLGKKVWQKSWEIWLPNEGCFTAKGRPSIYTRILGFLLRVFRLDFIFGRKLFCEWGVENREWGPSEVEVRVDGEKDVLTIRSSCDQTQITGILDQIKRIKQNTVKNKDLEKFVRDNPRLERVVLSFEYHLDRLRRKEVTAGHLLDSEWLQKNKVNDAIKLLCKKFPRQFGCMREGKKLALFKK